MEKCQYYNSQITGLLFYMMTGQSNSTKHEHPNKIHICELCKIKKDCICFCYCPKDNNLHYRCLDCTEKVKREKEETLQKLYLQLQ
jgi:hypothetical protein